MLSGAALIDLRGLDAATARRRCASLPTIPAGAHLKLVIGANAADPEVCHLVAEHIERLDIELLGEAWAVDRWLDQLRYGDLLGPSREPR